MRPEERLPTKRTASTGSRVPPAETSTRLPASGPLIGASSCSAARDDLLGLGHPPHAELALGRLALVGADEHDAARAQRLRVRARRRMRPHARVHRGRDEGRPAVGERRLGQHVVREPVRELRERVGRARGDEQQVGLREVEVDVVAGRPPRERPERLRGDEPLRAGGDERHDVVAGLHEEPADLAGLVGGDAAGDPEQDPSHEQMMPAPDQPTRPEANAAAGALAGGGSTRTGRAQPHRPRRAANGPGNQAEPAAVRVRAFASYDG